MKPFLKTVGLSAATIVAGIAVVCIYLSVNGPATTFLGAEQSAQQAVIGHPINITLRFRLPWSCDRSTLHPTLIGAPKTLVHADTQWRLVSWGLGYADWDMICILKGMDALKAHGTIAVHLPHGRAVALGFEPITIAMTADAGKDPAIRLASPAAPTAEQSRVNNLSILIGVVAALIVGALLWLLWRGERQDPPTPAEAAMAALSELAQSPPANPEKYYQRLTDVMRTYVSSVWHVPATTQTTRELLIVLESDETIVPRPLRELIREFLLRSDIVKYGGRNGDAEGMQYSREIAERLVRESEEAIKLGVRQ